jgi:hypothetical protein
LREISNFDVLKQDVDELLRLIENEWEYADMGGFKLTGDKEKERKLVLNTFGWSGNEDIITALRTNFGFWSWFWEMSQKGGHYEFTIKEIPKGG